MIRQISDSMSFEKKAELLEEQRAMTVKYYEGLQKQYEETQRILHDIKKHLQVFDNFDLQERKLAKEYTEELIKSIDDSRQQFHCTDKIVCTIFWDKIQACKRHGINIDINMQDIEFNFMDKIEVTVLFVNLLDNAMEACRESNSENKEINLRIHKFKEYVVINMRNTMGSEPIEREGRLISTKANHSGLGMVNLAELAKKYGGSLIYEYSEKAFETKIVLSVKG